MPTVKLTTKKIKSFNYEGKVWVKNGRTSYGRDVRWDTEISCFGLRIYPSGRKAFVTSYRVPSRKRLMVFGQFGSMTLTQARERARRHLVQVSDGADPLDEKRKAARAKTFQDLINKFIKDYAIGPRGKKDPEKKTWATDEGRLRRHTPPRWRNRKVGSITHDEVAALHAKIGETRRYEANRFLDLLRVMFRQARLWGMVPEGRDNPAEGVKKFKERSRKRWAKPEELPALAKAIDFEPNIYTRALIWLYLLSAARKTEILSARRDHVDWRRGQIRLPDTKSGEEQSLTLSAPALAILQALPAVEKNPYLFPGAKKGHHLVNIEKPWRRVRDRATVFLWAEGDEEVASAISALTRKLDRAPTAAEAQADAKRLGLDLVGDVRDITLHDLRRTTGSWMSQAGVDLNIIKSGLRHANISTTLIYSKLGEDAARVAFEEHGKRIMEAAGRHGPVEVVTGGGGKR